MAKAYTTKQGDSVDLIAYKEYGYSSGSSEEIYKANEFLLLDQSFILEPGITLILPDINVQPRTKSINPIWQ